MCQFLFLRYMGICWNKQTAVYCSYLNMPGRKYFGACLKQLPEELKLRGTWNSQWRHLTGEFNCIGAPIKFPHSFIEEQLF